MSEQVLKMFGNISEKYDLLNTILSFGIHYRWRKKAVKLSGIKKGMSVLDCATGTGDFAIAFRKKMNLEDKVIGTDFSEEMLKLANEKNAKHDYKIDFLQADALNLPFETNLFDIASIAFGIRNVDSTINCLKEMARVVKPGGKVIILEFGQPNGLFAHLYKFYSRYIIPFMGNLIIKDKGAYSYLNRSSERYPCREKFIEIMNDSNMLYNCRYYSLSLGIAFIYIAEVKK